MFILTTCWSFGQQTKISCVTTPDTLYGQQVYDFPTTFPKFGDGQKDFVRYMQKNLVYKADKDNPIYLNPLHVCCRHKWSSQKSLLTK